MQFPEKSGPDSQQHSFQEKSSADTTTVGTVNDPENAQKEDDDDSWDRGLAAWSTTAGGYVLALLCTRSPQRALTPSPFLTVHSLADGWACSPPLAYRTHLASSKTTMGNSTLRRRLASAGLVQPSCF